jgi:hypothetical protein
MKYGAKLLKKGDVILVIQLPLNQKGRMRLFTQNMTQQQTSAVADVMEQHLGWEELRLRKARRELKKGELPSCLASGGPKYSTAGPAAGSHGLQISSWKVTVYWH